MTALFFYQCLCILLYPFILIFVCFRLLKKKEDKTRLNERLGFPKKERPNGKLIWMHGASVGECLSMLPLVKKILQEDKNAFVISLESKEVFGEGFKQYDKESIK